MNLIAAIGLLFLDEEATFWYVVNFKVDILIMCFVRFLYVVIEKLLPIDYFSPGLLGAQADQVCGTYC